MQPQPPRASARWLKLQFVTSSQQGTHPPPLNASSSWVSDLPVSLNGDIWNLKTWARQDIDHRQKLHKKCQMWHQKNHSVNYESDFQLHHQFIGAPHLSAPNVKLGPGPAPTGPRAGAFEFWHLIVEIWFGEKVSTNTTLGLPRQEFTKKLNPSLYKIWSSNVSTHPKARDMKSIQWQDFWYCCMNCNNIQRTHTHEHATKEAKQITENLKHIPKRHTKTKKARKRQKETERDKPKTLLIETPPDPTPTFHFPK